MLFVQDEPDIYAAERKLILLVAYKHKKQPYTKRQMEAHLGRLHRNPLNQIPVEKAAAVAGPLEAARKAKVAAAAEIKAKLDKAASISADELAKVDPFISSFHCFPRFVCFSFFLSLSNF